MTESLPATLLAPSHTPHRIQYISPMRYGFLALVVNEFSGLQVGSWEGGGEADRGRGARERRRREVYAATLQWLIVVRP